MTQQKTEPVCGLCARIGTNDPGGPRTHSPNCPNRAEPQLHNPAEWNLSPGGGYIVGRDGAVASNPLVLAGWKACADEAKQLREVNGKLLAALTDIVFCLDAGHNGSARKKAVAALTKGGA